MYIYVKSFKQYAFDPILLNRATSYFHKTLIRHCLCFEVFQLHHSNKKRRTVKFVKAKKIKIEIFKHNGISYEKNLVIVF